MASFASFQNEISQLQLRNKDPNNLGNHAGKASLTGKGVAKDAGAVQTIETFDDGRTVLVSRLPWLLPCLSQI